MKKQNKYSYLWIVQGFYGSWEDVAQSEIKKESLQTLKEYRYNDHTHPYRIIYRRELNEN